MTYRKKLIEVALPLDAINREAAREKSIRHGHPSALHLWWARRPLAACRAVLFASLVDDPSSRPEEFSTEDDQLRERERLFALIEELVKWENINDERILGRAREEILKSTNGNPPPVLDPFCGGGSIPLEAQRIGLKARASDLNPIAVLITKAMIEIPSHFAEQPPVNPDAQNNLTETQTFKRAAGLAEDVCYYGRWMRDQAEKRIGHLYPKVKLPKKLGGGEATVIAWIWARRVKCSNPACEAKMPLVKQFWLAKKRGKMAWIEPIVDHANKCVKFEVKSGEGIPREGTVDRSGARCLICEETVSLDYVRAEGMAGRMDQQLMAIVAEGKRRRIYLAPSDEHIAIAGTTQPPVVPEIDLPQKAIGFAVQPYGMTQHKHLFTSRQLVAMTTFSNLVSESRETIEANARTCDCEEPGRYADAVVTYLAFNVDQLANHQSSICSWNATNSQMRSVFDRQALPMVWDFAESNPFCESSGSFKNLHERLVKGFQATSARLIGEVSQIDAASQIWDIDLSLISTDPPYHDNIGYADLSDFFYVWLRRNLKDIYPQLFALMRVPKTQELVANRFRFGGDKAHAEEHFLVGLGKAFRLMRSRAHPDFPMTVYYAFKQSEADTRGGGISSTGWETMLEGLLNAGFQLTATLPMRTEKPGRSRDIGSNALASSIVLACRPRPPNSLTASRRDFLSVLRKELPQALMRLQRGNIAPVDLAQAAIGPGMAVFSRFRSVLEADGTPMRVRTALQIINGEIDVYFADQEGDLDADTRFCTAWFEQFGMNEGAFGAADVLARAKNSSVGGISESGVLRASAGKVRLLSRDEYPDDWDPALDRIAVSMRGRAPNTLSVPSIREERSKPGGWSIDSVGDRAKTPVGWHTVSTPSAKEKAGHRKPLSITRSLPHGRIFKIRLKPLVCKNTHRNRTYFN